MSFTRLLISKKDDPIIIGKATPADVSSDTP